MKRYVLMLAVAVVAAISVSMISMSVNETALVDAAKNHCAPDMELLASADKYLCIDGTGKGYTLARN